MRQDKRLSSSLHQVLLSFINRTFVEPQSFVCPASYCPVLDVRAVLLRLFRRPSRQDHPDTNAMAALESCWVIDRTYIVSQKLYKVPFGRWVQKNQNISLDLAYAHNAH